MIEFLTLVLAIMTVAVLAIRYAVRRDDVLHSGFINQDHAE
jgi:hypothetical protein